MPLICWIGSIVTLGLLGVALDRKTKDAERRHKVITDLQTSMNNNKGWIWEERTQNPFQRDKIKILAYKDNYVLYQFYELKGGRVYHPTTLSSEFDFIYRNYTPTALTIIEEES